MFIAYYISIILIAHCYISTLPQPILFIESISSILLWLLFLIKSRGYINISKPILFSPGGSVQTLKLSDATHPQSLKLHIRLMKQLNIFIQILAILMTGRCNVSYHILTSEQFKSRSDNHIVGIGVMSSWWP